MNIAIFASGGGSNALRIIEHFREHPNIRVALVIANRYDAGVLTHAFRNSIPSVVINKKLLNDESIMGNVFATFNIDFVALAGFLLLMPQFIVERFEGHMVNIHPALLPKYGGKGMYGMNVHRAVKEAGENESGMTIHFVNTKYDEGGIIEQQACQLDSSDSPESIAAKVLGLEHMYYAPAIERVIENLKNQ